MAIISTYCRKGGVGKTTLLGYFAHYLVRQGHTAMILSIDDQNSIFKVFGIEGKIFDRSDDYFEFFLKGHVNKKTGQEIGPEDILKEARTNLYLIKTLNTDTLSRELLIDRQNGNRQGFQEQLVDIIHFLAAAVDYFFIDFPPSSSSLTEVLLGESDHIIAVVGLDVLGIDGFFNTLQYFTDAEIDINKIDFVIPNFYALNKRAPQNSLATLHKQAKDFTPNAVVTDPLRDVSIIKNLQEEGWSAYDENLELKPYDLKKFGELRIDLDGIFDQIDVGQNKLQKKDAK